MIDPGSLVGFGLAFVATAWIGSAVVCAAVLLVRPWLARLGPDVERTAAAAALILVPFAAGALVMALALFSLSPGWFYSVDHCSHHGHHPHLCLLHGGSWADEAWGGMLLCMALSVLAIWIVRRTIGWWRASRALRQLRRIAQPGPSGVFIAPADRAFCFAAGLLRPFVYISTAAWTSLESDERQAVLAHERAHIAQADLRRHVVLDLAALLGAPWLARRVLALWRSASERVCDRRAAGEVSPTAVASALVTMSRLASGRTLGLSFGRSHAVVERVEAVLADVPTGAEVARRMVRAGWALLAAMGAASLVFADPVHHLLETLLGAL